MKYIQKIIIVSLMAALFFPYQVRAASNSVNPACQNIIAQARKTYALVVKNNDAIFNLSLKNAEKSYKDALKAGANKIQAQIMLRENAAQAFEARKQTVEDAASDLDKVMDSGVITCLQASQPAPSKLAVTKFCTSLINSYVTLYNAEGKTQATFFKKTYPTRDEAKIFAADNKEMMKVFNQIKNASKQLCEQFYSEYFHSDSGSGGYTSESADVKRVADIRQMASALELYYYDNNSYPANLSLLSPNYISAIPIPPAASGSKCSNAQNAYMYTKLSDATYELKFCIAKKTAGIEAGVRTLSESGIQ